MRPHAITTIPAALTLLAAPPAAQAQLLGEPHGLIPMLSPGGTREHVVGDLDGDGDLDVLLARFGHDAVVTGDGSGRFEQVPGAIPTPTAPSRSAALGDVDGDADLDAVIGRYYDVGLYRNDGTARFEDVSAALPTHPEEPRVSDAAFLDANADGALDLVIGSLWVDRLYLGDGAGGFRDAPPLAQTSEETLAVAVLDADGDGDPDLLLGKDGASSQLLKNDGAGRFRDDSELLPVVGARSCALAVGDVDRDGDDDVLVGTGGDGDVHAPAIYLQGDAGVFRLASLGSERATGYFAAVAVGDLDGDLDLDLYLGREGTSHSYFFPASDLCFVNDGAGGFTLAEDALPPWNEPTGSVVLFDADSDGDLDALLGERDRLLLGDGAGRLWIDPDPLPPTAQDGVIGAGDVDADGDLDVVIATGTEGFFDAGPQTRFFRNDGTGFFDDETDVVFEPAAPAHAYDKGYAEDVDLVDVDGDGDLDLLVSKVHDSDGSGGGLRLYRNAHGAFRSWTEALPALGDVRDLAPGDVDGDGDADLVAAQLFFDALLFNRGAGRFALAGDELPQPAEPDHTYGVALGDVDEDGDLDLLLGNHSLVGSSVGARNTLYRNDGAGVFSDASERIPAEAEHTTAVALADLDRDGDLDAVIANWEESDRLYENQGGGWFADATAAKLPPSGGTEAIGIGDLDRDGWPDLMLGERLRLNVAGVFTSAEVLAPALSPGAASSVVVGDLDGDLDLDVLLGSIGFPERARALSNLLRQTVRRGSPRAGKPFTLEVRGLPHAAYALALAPRAAAIPAPPFGTLYLDPSALALAALGVLDADGRALHVFVVPADPLAVGATMQFQALVGPDPLLANRAEATVTDW